MRHASIQNQQRTSIFQLKHLKLWLGGILTFITVFMGAVYFFGQPWSITDFDLAIKLQSPSFQHWLGTDIYGRDVFTLLMGSAYNALRVGIIAVSIGLIAGVTLGLLAAFSKSRVDNIIMRSCDLLFAFPAILLAIMLIATFGPSITNAIIAIGIANIPVYTRLTRNTIRTILPKNYILAAYSLGRSKKGIIQAHIFPNLLPLLIIQSSVQLSMAIMAEATLTYLNLGTQPPEPSWGRMLYEAQSLLFSNPAMAIIPGLALALTILGLNQLGDGLRDLLTPKTRSSYTLTPLG